MIYASAAVPIAEHLTLWRLNHWEAPEGRMVLCPPYPETAHELRAYLTDVGPDWRAEVKAARRDGVCEAYYTQAGRRVRVTSAAAWFGRAELSVAEVRTLFDRLEWHLMRAFNREKPAPLVSPNVCGMTLWRDEMEDRCPELPEDVQQLIRATSGQGRREVLTPREYGDTIPGFWYWDMRLAYPAFMEHLPVGPHEWRTAPELTPELRGRVKVTATIPRDWAHVGILPVKVAWEGSRFPSSPGHTFTSWCDASEARLAASHGWKVEVHEALALCEGRPLDTWSRRLKKLYAWFEAEEEEHLKRAIRAILLNTLGDLNGRGRMQEKVLLSSEGRTATRRFREARGGARPSHPEWAAAVWARCRYRLAKYLLAAPRPLLLGAYVDAAYTAADPGWPPSTSYGHMRLKGRWLGEKPAPTTEPELWELARQAEANWLAAALGDE